MNSKSISVCPRCGQHKYRLVSEIVAEGTLPSEAPIMTRLAALSRGNLIEDETTYEAHYTTILARRLERPSSLLPNLSQPPHPDTVVESLIRNKLKRPYQLIGRIAKIIFLLCCFLSIWMVITHGAVLVFLILAGISILISVLAYIYTIRIDPSQLTLEQISKFEPQVDLAKHEYAKYLRDVHMIQHANKRYDRLNYCYACDGVFDPKDDQKRILSPGQMLLLLFSE